MALEQTLAIIKPDAIKNKHIGHIIEKIEAKGFAIQQAFMLQLAQEEAAEFYHIHADKPFFNDLTTFMSSAPLMIMILEKENAIAEWRTLMGATNPSEAEAGTIRAEYANSIDENAVHGSDSVETAFEEITFFFDADEALDFEETPESDTAASE